jgi:hypothetical protein
MRHGCPVVSQRVPARSGCPAGNARVAPLRYELVGVRIEEARPEQRRHGVLREQVLNERPEDRIATLAPRGPVNDAPRRGEPREPPDGSSVGLDREPWSASEHELGDIPGRVGRRGGSRCVLRQRGAHSFLPARQCLRERHPAPRRLASSCQRAVPPCRGRTNPCTRAASRPGSFGGRDRTCIAGFRDRHELQRASRGLYAVDQGVEIVAVEGRAPHHDVDAVLQRVDDGEGTAAEVVVGREVPGAPAALDDLLEHLGVALALSASRPPVRARQGAP